jgi:hypothetical protein
MAETDFQRQRPFVETANQMEHLRSLILHAGRDHLIEPERSFEFVSAFDNCEELVCETKEEKESDDDGMIVKEVCQRFTQKHPKNVAVYFPNEDHFLQKHRAKLIGEAIKLLLKSKTDSTNDNSKL